MASRAKAGLGTHKQNGEQGWESLNLFSRIYRNVTYVCVCGWVARSGGGVLSSLLPAHAVVLDNLRWPAHDGTIVTSLMFLDRCCYWRTKELFWACRGCWRAPDNVTSRKLLDCRHWRAEEFVSFFLPCVPCLSLLCSCGLV